MGAIFDPLVLQSVVNKHIGKPMKVMVSAIAEELHEHYPGHINRDPPWVLNNAGGAMGAFALLHASITEYLIVFGTPIGTEGHSGRHLADDYFFMLEGEQWSFSPGETDREVYKAGDMHLLRRGNVQGYRIPENGWALEYARGFIPSMMPFGVLDVLTSTLDFPTLAKTLGIYARGVTRELMRGKI